LTPPPQPKASLDSPLRTAPLKTIETKAWPFGHGHGQGHDQATILSTHVVPIGSLLDPTALNATLYLEVIRTTQASHQSIDDIHNRYFNGIHGWIPFICPDRFQKDLAQFQLVPTAEFSLVLLCMGLISYDPPQTHPSPIGHEVLYLNAKTLFTQIQVLRRPTIHLIQAGIFISIYEYAHGRPDSALASIAICARMAYKAGIHHKPEVPGWSQAWNTWWAIRIFERIFYSETELTEFPLTTSAPDESDPLPFEVHGLECVERSKSNDQIAPLTSEEAGCLGRAAQAVYLLDQVMQAIKITSVDSRISRLIDLDSQLQQLLSVTMNKCHGKLGAHCGAVGTSIR
jgi:hypothetical protein